MTQPAELFAQWFVSFIPIRYYVLNEFIKPEQILIERRDVYTYWNKYIYAIYRVLQVYTLLNQIKRDNSSNRAVRIQSSSTPLFFQLAPLKKKIVYVYITHEKCMML